PASERSRQFRVDPESRHGGNTGPGGGWRAVESRRGAGPAHANDLARLRARAPFQYLLRAVENRMKLRIHGNSLRLRLNRTEVAELAQSGRVENALEFGQRSKLIYSVE